MSKKAEIKRLTEEAESFLKGKWFAPLLAEIGVLEMDNPPEISGIGAALEEDAPDWSFKCLLKGATSVAGTPFGIGPSEFGTKEFGLFLGMKWSVISGFAASLSVLKKLTAEQIAKIESAWGAGFVSEQIAFLGHVSEKQFSKLQRIKQRALQLAEAQGSTEEKEFLRGLSEGVTYLQAVGEKMKAAPQADKEAMDEQKRNLVHLFGAVCGAEIEKRKDETSWPGITKKVYRKSQRVRRARRILEAAMRMKASEESVRNS